MVDNPNYLRTPFGCGIRYCSTTFIFVVLCVTAASAAKPRSKTKTRAMRRIRAYFVTEAVYSRFVWRQFVFVRHRIDFINSSTALHRWSPWKIWLTKLVCKCLQNIDTYFEMQMFNVNINNNSLILSTCRVCRLFSNKYGWTGVIQSTSRFVMVCGLTAHRAYFNKIIKSYLNWILAKQRIHSEAQPRSSIGMRVSNCFRYGWSAQHRLD